MPSGCSDLLTSPVIRTTFQEILIVTAQLLTQAVWKRFSYPNNCKQPGEMDLDATG